MESQSDPWLVLLSPRPESSVQEKLSLWKSCWNSCNIALIESDIGSPISAKQAFPQHISI